MIQPLRASLVPRRLLIVRRLRHRLLPRRPRRQQRHPSGLVITPEPRVRTRALPTSMNSGVISTASSAVCSAVAKAARAGPVEAVVQDAEAFSRPT